MKNPNQVIYKPLGMAPIDRKSKKKHCIIDEDDSIGSEEDERDGGSLAWLDGDDDDDDEADDRDILLDKIPLSLPVLSLRRIRLILYSIATILFLIFMVKLITNDKQVPASSDLPSAAAIMSTRGVGELASSKFSSEYNSKTLPGYEQTDFRPQYENYLTSILRNEDKFDGLQGLHSIDDLKYRELGQTKDSDRQYGVANKRWWSTDFRASNKYVTLTNYIRAMKSFNFNSSITLTTQATTDYMHHTLELCRRWDGPISVAIFCPGQEMTVAITLIKFMRDCLPMPLSACIKDKVTWHLVYNRAHGPPASEIGYPASHLDSANYVSFTRDGECPRMPGPGVNDTISQYELELRKVNTIYTRSYRQQFELVYPINVLRNTARLAAKTHFIMASDIELYPSINLVPNFINFISNRNIGDLKDDFGLVNLKKFVFTLPIFEVESNVVAPGTKRELVKLLEESKATFFHKWVCDACQNFPNRLDWLETDKFGSSEFHARDNELIMFEATQRNKSRDSWEPIFIGTNDDPLYDDRLSWDGRRDKMAQMYEMCLQDYHLFVLGNAFLVHAPGIKHIDQGDVTKRLKYIRENNSIYDASIAKLKQQYASSLRINEC